MHKVGYLEGIFSDPGRRSWSGFGPRPLGCAVWYPAAGDAHQEMWELGPPGQALFRMGRVAARASLSPTPALFPVVLMSHGTGGSAPQMGWLGCRLAQLGYVCVAVSHHGNTTAEPYLAEGFLGWWERAPDLSRTLDCVAADPWFAGRLDRDRTFAAGFSLGGYTVLALAGAITDLGAFDRWAADSGLATGPREFPDLGQRVPALLASSPEFEASRRRHRHCYRDGRVKAVLACAPAPTVRGFTLESLAQIEIPIAIICGQGDTEAPPEAGACWLERHIPGCELTLLGAEVGHYVFLCEATDLGRSLEPEICRDAPGVDRRAIHDRAAALAAALFQSARPAPC